MVSQVLPPVFQAWGHQPQEARFLKSPLLLRGSSGSQWVWGDGGGGLGVGLSPSREGSSGQRLGTRFLPGGAGKAGSSPWQQQAAASGFFFRNANTSIHLLYLATKVLTPCVIKYKPLKYISLPDSVSCRRRRGAVWERLNQGGRGRGREPVPPSGCLESRGYQMVIQASAW